MRCLIVGAGSIGSRRARLLAEMGHHVGVEDANQERAVALCESLPENNADTRYFDPWDAVFICTPAHTHVALARARVTSGIRGLFIEKPLSVSMDGIAELLSECEARGVVTMGACNVRWGYREVPAGPHDEAFLCLLKPLSGWREGAEVYREQGVILAAAIHEMDVARMLCGPITRMDVYGDNDTVELFLNHDGDRKSLIIASWREGPVTARWLRINGETHSYHADPSDEQYRQEMAHFLDHVASGTATTNPIANAAEILGWALKARDMTRSVTV